MAPSPPAAWSRRSTRNPALRSPAAPGCLSATGIATLGGAFGTAALIFIAGLNRLSTVNVGDNDARLFPGQQQLGDLHPTISQHQPDQPSTIGLRYTHEQGDFGRLQQQQHYLPGQQASSRRS
jgi:hypothetical protein